LKIKIISIFPEIFSGFLQASLVEKAITKGIFSVETINLRDFADPPHFHVDDTPYGGGAGMVIKPEPLARAIESAKQDLTDASVILLSASGEPFTQQGARELSQKNELILICGRYEGVDQRVIDLMIDRELSIGEYVLMGGEVAAMVIIEATTRLIAGVLGNPESIAHESFSSEALLEGPQYTRPATFRDQTVPEVLLSGDHKKIVEWHSQQSFERTLSNRPELLSSPRKPGNKTS